MDQKVNIYQVHFDSASRHNCYPEFLKYNNSGRLNQYFENQVIVDLIKAGAHKDSAYFGVWSHDIKNELVFKEDGKTFTPDYFCELVIRHKCDVYGLQKRRKNPNIVRQAEQYHPGFVAMMTKILDMVGYGELPHRLDYIILFNHFVMRSEIYEQYVTELLKPAMEALQAIPEAWNEARYKRMDEATKQRFMAAYGKPYYPYHPFLLERLPSIFMQKHKFSFKHLF